MNKLNMDASTPLYQQLCEALTQSIQNGEYRVGDRIPSEAKLTELYGVSRITVRTAVEKLCAENVLIKKHGKGTYVSAPLYTECTKAGNSFTELCLLMGAVPSTKLVSKEVIQAPEAVAEALDLELGADVICIKRLRLVNGAPMICELDYFRPEHGYLLLELGENSLMKLVRERTGLTSHAFEDSFGVAEATPDQAKYLETDKGFSLLKVSQKVMSEQGDLIYYNEQFIRSDSYKYVIRR
ncbi:MAG: GntR family transcriptional regulator [Tissierellia bacterium]|nr:GntR family transcriptional regulator [Tissierellia bacterium]